MTSFRKGFRTSRFLALTLMTVGSLVACGCGGSGGGTSEAAVVKPSVSALPYSGKVLILPLGLGLPSQVLDLSNGQSVDLPQSDRDLRFGHRDVWDSSHDGQELIRRDDVGGISVFAFPSLQEQARFRPKMAEGEDLRVGAVRMSRDRQWMAAAISSENDLKAKLRVFDRQGNIVALGPKASGSATATYDWMPDGRLVFLDGEQLFFYDVRKNQISSVDLKFPAPTEAGGEGLAVSPDGRKIALTRYTFFQLGDRVRRHGVAYVFTPEGGLGRALTEPASRTLDSASGLRLGRPTWDPQGSYVAFTVSLSGDAAGAPTLSACSSVSVVSAAASAPAPVVGISLIDPSEMRFIKGGSAEGRVGTCGNFRWW